MKFTTANFEAEVLKSDIPVMVDFYADWCGPCKMMGPIVEKMAEKYAGKVKIGKLNYHPSDIDWKKFGEKAEALCKSLGLDYYIKDGLRAEMEK